MLIIGIKGAELAPDEHAWITTPQVSGVILFKRNFVSRDQVTRLIAQLRALRGDAFLITVDQEGGPVQRFQGDDFTRFPALARVGELYEREPQQALALAEQHAWLMASEMRAIDIDLSFAPVVDLKLGNRAIGERALHTNPQIVSALGLAYLRGMRLAGMAATIKHFPGHGSVLEDTHFDNAADPRTLDELRQADLIPFADAIDAGAEAVMMAHVAYPRVDPKPAGYSRVWIEDILRGEYGFPRCRDQRRYQHGGGGKRRRHRRAYRSAPRGRLRSGPGLQTRNRAGITRCGNCYRALRSRASRCAARSHRTNLGRIAQ